MRNLLGNFTPSSASKRFLSLLQHYGVWKTAAVCVAMIDDVYVRSFDRKFRVRTSGHVELSETSFDASKLDQATAYGPVNAWALRKLLRKLDLPKTFAFSDLGCGMGRACIIAAEYGFARVTGVELAPELSRVARENISSCALSPERKSSIQIIEGDALDYCNHSDDDVYFMFRAFSLPFLQNVLDTLVRNAVCRKKPFLLIYTERLSWPPSNCVSAIGANPSFRNVYAGSLLGQAFFVYRCEPADE